MDIDHMTDLASLMAVIGKELEIPAEQLDDSSSPETVQSWDSLTHFNIFMAIQSEFGIKMKAADALAMRNFGEIRMVLRRYGITV